MFNTGKPQHRDDLINAVLEKYPNLPPYYFELVGNEEHKTRLYGKIDNLIRWYSKNEKIYNVEKGSGLWQSTSKKTSNLMTHQIIIDTPKTENQQGYILSICCPM